MFSKDNILAILIKKIAVSEYRISKKNVVKE